MKQTISDYTKELEEATDGILQLDNRAKEVSKRVKDEFGFDFVALQMIDVADQIIQTIDVAGYEDRWYQVATHPIDVVDELRDIQAYVARSNMIEIIRGRHARFDHFIYTKFGHEGLLRIFVPLIVIRDSDGRISEAHPEWFYLELLTSENSVVSCDVQVVSCDVQDARMALQIRARSAEEIEEKFAGLLRPNETAGNWTMEVIGTIEAGYDCRHLGRERRDCPSMSVCSAHQLFRRACQHAIKLSGATLGHVLQEIARCARELTGADRANFVFAHPKLAKFNETIWSGPRDIGPDWHRTAHPIPSTSSDPKRGELVLWFRPDNPRSSLITDDNWELFLRWKTKDALTYTMQQVQSLNFARQLNNLHDIALSVANDLESDDLLQCLAGHTLNLLAADVVVIHEFAYDGTTVPAIAGTPLKKSSKDHLIFGNPHDWLLKHADLPEFSPALTPQGLARLYGPPEKSSQYVAEVLSERLESGAAVLLRDQQQKQVVGLMLVSYRRRRNFSKSHLKALGTVAANAAIAMRNRAQVRVRELSLQEIASELHTLSHSPIRDLGENSDSIKTMQGQLAKIAARLIGLRKNPSPEPTSI